MKLFLPSFLALTLLLTACQENKNTPLGLKNHLGTVHEAAIVNGKNISPKNKIGHSIVAIISSQEGGQALCTGSIISENTILTAAHCVDNEPQDLHLIFGNDIKKVSNENMRKADKFVVQPNWQQHLPSGEGDLAIIHFQGDLPVGFVPVVLAN